MKEFMTFDELKKEFNWDTTTDGIQKQINYAKRRGVNIEVGYKKGKTYFHVLNTLQTDDWKEYPKNSRYEVSKQGLVRVKETKTLVGAETSGGYVSVADTLQNPTKHYKVHRMVMETFNPIENSELYIVDHINGIKKDNRLENLRWLTQRQNVNARDENYAKLNSNFQKLIEKYGYEELNSIFKELLQRPSKN